MERIRGLFGERQEARHFTTAAIIGAGGAVAAAGVTAGGSIFSSMQAKKAGKLSSAEKRYIERQRQREEEIYQFQKMMQPQILKELGLDAEVDENGTIISVKRSAETPEDAKTREIARLAQERVLAALRGEGEVDPATERRLRKQEQLARAKVRQAFGAGGEMSTAGANLLARNAEAANMTRYGVSRDAMMSSDQLARANLGLLDQGETRRIAALTGLPLQSLQFAQTMTPYELQAGQAQRLGQAYQANRNADLFGGIGVGIRDVAGSLRTYLNESASRRTGTQPRYESDWSGMPQEGQFWEF